MAGQSVTISAGASVSASSTGEGDAGNVTVQGLASPAQSVLIDGAGSGIFTDTQGTGAGGNISVNADSVTLQNGGTLSAATSGTEVTATGGNITIQGSDVQFKSGAVVTTDTSGAGHGGMIDVVATESLSLKDASSINTNSNSLLENAGNAGDIRLNAPVIDVQTALVSASTVGPGNAGNIVLEANRVILGASETGQLHGGQGADIFTRTAGPGQAGDITIRGRTGPESQADSVTISGSSRMNSESIFGASDVQGNAGNISIHTGRLTLSDGTLSTASSSSTGNAGTITIVASDEVTISSNGRLSSGAIEFASGNGGRIAVSAPTVVVERGGFISTNTDYIGNAGEIQVKANSLQLKTGGQINSSSVINQGAPDFIPSGSAGIITIQGLASPAHSILIDGAGSGIFTDTQGTGAGGNISVNADSVTLQNGGTLSAATSGTASSATGGTITVDAANTVTMNSASITSSSTGVADAGSIKITGLNGFTMQNSTVTTQAGQGAGGGDIEVTTSPDATVLLQNSKISASVADGHGGGGNISIDPQFVILQNSQILAQAAQGQGGAITIIANLFLPDANSRVNADSGSGTNGTITIQSPNAPVSGQIQPLNKTPLLATTLLTQRCAALAGGQFSSFTVAGRGSLPTEPGSWLTSPLFAGGVGTGEGLSGLSGLSGFSGLSGVVQAGLVTHQTDQIDKTDQTDQPLLSLRQIAPAGFLTQAFAVDEPAGCQS
jgi:large exoprotein involved in heme utilization and adhesion